MVAVVVTTAAFRHNHGFNFYPEHRGFAVPYGAGFRVGGYFLLNAAALLPRDSQELRTRAWGLRLEALLLLAILLASNTVNAPFYDSHLTASAVLLLYELGITGLLAHLTGATVATIASFIVESSASALAMLSNPHVIYYRIEGTIVVQRVFSTHLAWRQAAAPTPRGPDSVVPYDHDVLRARPTRGHHDPHPTDASASEVAGQDPAHHVSPFTGHLRAARGAGSADHDDHPVAVVGDERRHRLHRGVHPTRGSR